MFDHIFICSFQLLQQAAETVRWRQDLQGFHCLHEGSTVRHSRPAAPAPLARRGVGGGAGLSLCQASGLQGV